jgi:hypothetical protein
VMFLLLAKKETEADEAAAQTLAYESS